MHLIMVEALHILAGMIVALRALAMLNIDDMVDAMRVLWLSIT